MPDTIQERIIAAVAARAEVLSNLPVERARRSLTDKELVDAGDRFVSIWDGSDTAQAPVYGVQRSQFPVAIEVLWQPGDINPSTSAMDVKGDILLAIVGPTVSRALGLVSGGLVTPAASEDDDAVDVSAALAFMGYTLTAFTAAADVAITRPDHDVAKVSSITLKADGTLAVLAGKDGATTAFSATRGANGGPPVIPETSIELAQIKLISATAAAITAAQIVAMTAQPSVDLTLGGLCHGISYAGESHQYPDDGSGYASMSVAFNIDYSTVAGNPYTLSTR